MNIYIKRLFVDAISTLPAIFSLGYSLWKVKAYGDDTHEMMTMEIILALLVIVFLFHVIRDIRMMLTLRLPVVAAEEGLYMKSRLIPWETITSIYVVKLNVCIQTNTENDELASMNVFLRFLKLIHALKYGTCNTIGWMDFSGSASSFREYLEGERKFYLERKERR